MNLVWEPGNDKKVDVVCISESLDNREITSTKPNIIFSKHHYLYVWWNVAKLWILKKWILRGQQEKNMDFDFSKFSFSCHLQIDKKTPIL